MVWNLIFLLYFFTNLSPSLLYCYLLENTFLSVRACICPTVFGKLSYCLTSIQTYYHMSYSHMACKADLGQDTFFFACKLGESYWSLPAVQQVEHVDPKYQQQSHLLCEVLKLKLKYCILVQNIFISNFKEYFNTCSNWSRKNYVISRILKVKFPEIFYSLKYNGNNINTRTPWPSQIFRHCQWLSDGHLCSLYSHCF